MERHTIFLTLAGSQAHGTARLGSDFDCRGVCIAPLSLRLSLFRSFEQYDGVLPEPLAAIVFPLLTARPGAAQAARVKTECVIFDLAKFVGLCAAANPNALEILFADERDWLLASPAWHLLYGERQRFLTKKVQHTFSGYALAQLRKIKTHRSWLLNPPTKRPLREDFGLSVASATLSRDDQNRIEQSLAEKLRSYGIDDMDLPKAARVALQDRFEAFYRDVLAASEVDLEERMRAVATHALQLPAAVVNTLNAEKKYRAAMKQWESYQAWKVNRNPARAELERRYGYDTKHAMHLIRLMRMGCEVLQKGELSVRRSDAAELLAIRDGALTFEELLATANALQSTLQAAAAQTQLPSDVEHEKVDELLGELLSSTSAAAAPASLPLRRG